MIVPVPLAKAYRILNHGPVTLVGTRHGLRRNVMAASWAMPLDFDPPKVAVVIDRNTLTRELVDASGEFTLSIPPRAIAAQVIAAGSHSGRERDKFDQDGLQTFPAQIVSAPLLAGCVAWLECKVIPKPDNQLEHDLFIAQVVAASADDRAFADGHWNFREDSLRTLHYVAGGHFFLTGEELSLS